MTPPSAGNGSAPIAEAQLLPDRVEVAVVGAGFAGIAMAHNLMKAGLEDFVVLEREQEVGGTWHLNTYPGCQCDVASHMYSLSFAPNPNWSRTFSRQPEIAAYLRDTAERFGITPHIRLGTHVLEAAWDEDEQLWRLETSRGPLAARFVVAGAGPFPEPKTPEWPGLDDFEGTVFHTARWKHDHDLTGERVAVVGTGASSIQVVPQIVKQVDRLHLFQRTPAWVFPHTDRPTTRFERTLYRVFPPAQRLIRTLVYWNNELRQIGFLNPPIMRLASRIALRHLKRQVPDPELRRKLTPDYTMGCKRVCPSNRFYPALTRPNAELVTEAVTGIRGNSIVTADGREREVDTIILGTGFNVTEPRIANHITGRGGRTLAEAWAERGSMSAYLGSAIPGFPNAFLLLGPNTGGGHNSVVFMIEAQAAHIAQALAHLRERGLGEIEVREGVHDAYNERIQRRMKGTVWTSGCRSYYMDASGNVPAIWPDFTWRFNLKARNFDPSEYVTAPLRPAREPAVAKAA